MRLLLSVPHSLRVRRFSKLQFFVVENGIRQRDRDAIALGGLSFRGVFQPQEPILCFSRLRLHVPQDRSPLQMPVTGCSPPIRSTSGYKSEVPVPPP